MNTERPKHTVRRNYAARMHLTSLASPSATGRGRHRRQPGRAWHCGPQKRPPGKKKHMEHSASMALFPPSATLRPTLRWAQSTKSSVRQPGTPQNACEECTSVHTVCRHPSHVEFKQPVQQTEGRRNRTRQHELSLPAIPYRAVSHRHPSPDPRVRRRVQVGQRTVHGSMATCTNFYSGRLDNAHRVGD